MKKSETDKKCREILEAIVQIANSEGEIAFEEDFGFNTLTVLVGQAENRRHTHVGFPDCSFEQMIDSLHRTLLGKSGLSWC